MIGVAVLGIAANKEGLNASDSALPVPYSN